MLCIFASTNSINFFNCNMMKKIFKNLGGVLMLVAALVFTSCDQIKSSTDNPVPAIDPILATPLTIEAKAEDGATVRLLKTDDSYELKTIKYKKSTDTSWKDYKFNDVNGDEISLNKGESVSFWSNNAALTLGSDWMPLYSYFVISDECYVYGNVMSMIDDQEGATAENPKFSTDEEIGASYAFYYLFQYCPILNHESKELVLPATKLTSNCYNSMFTGCSSLTKAPELKAKELKESCYSSMFYFCTSLEEAPEIAAETVAPYCCQTMFAFCSSLTKAPVLKAKTLENSCYSYMFYSCQKLGSLTCLATSVAGCIAGWLGDAGSQVEGDKILYVHPSMTNEPGWNLGSGWTVESAAN